MGVGNYRLDIYLGDRVRSGSIPFYHIVIPLFFRDYLKACEDRIRVALDLHYPHYHVSITWEDQDPPVKVTPADPIVREKVIRLIDVEIQNVKDIFDE